MGLSDKLPPADQTAEEATRAHMAAWQAGEEDHEGEAAEEYELDGEGLTAAQYEVPVHVALARARADMPRVGKRDRFEGGNAGRFNFRGVDRVVNATRPVLARHGLVVVPELLGVDRRDVPRSSGQGKSTETVVRVQYHVIGPQGDALPVPLVVVAEALDTADKGAAKAMSVAWRTALIQLLHIATGDPDPDSVMIERGDGDIDRGQAAFDPQAYRTEALRVSTSPARLNQMINDLQRLGRGSELVPNEFGEDEKLGSMLFRLRQERAARKEAPNADR